MYDVARPPRFDTPSILIWKPSSVMSCALLKTISCNSATPFPRFDAGGVAINSLIAEILAFRCFSDQDSAEEDQVRFSSCRYGPITLAKHNRPCTNLTTPFSFVTELSFWFLSTLRPGDFRLTDFTVVGNLAAASRRRPPRKRGHYSRASYFESAGPERAPFSAATGEGAYCDGYRFIGAAGLFFYFPEAS